MKFFIMIKGEYEVIKFFQKRSDFMIVMINGVFGFGKMLVVKMF